MKKIAIFLALLFVLLLGSYSLLFPFGNYAMIEYNGVKYVPLDSLGEVQPPNVVGDDVTIYLVRSNGKVNYDKPYEARTYAEVSDPEQIFLFFDSMNWIKEGHQEINNHDR